MRLSLPASFLALLTLLAACSADGGNQAARSPEAATEATTSSPLNAVPADQLAVTGPQVLAGTDWVLYPLPLTEQNKADESDGSGFRGRLGSSYEGRNQPAHYWEAVFYNARTGQLRQLAPGRNLLIRAIESAQHQFLGPADAEQTQPAAGTLSFAPSPYTSENLLLYAITTTDFNRDGRLGSADPTYLFVSTKSGEHFRQVSPDSLHVTGWHFQPTTGKLLLTVVPDHNHDHRFNEADESVPYVADLRTGQPATPVLPDSLTNALLRQLAQHWPPQP